MLLAFEFTFISFSRLWSWLRGFSSDFRIRSKPRPGVGAHNWQKPMSIFFLISCAHYRITNDMISLLCRKFFPTNWNNFQTPSACPSMIMKAKLNHPAVLTSQSVIKLPSLLVLRHEKGKNSRRNCQHNRKPISFRPNNLPTFHFQPVQCQWL